MADLLAKAGIATSKSDARRMIAAGGAYLNNARVPAEDAVPDPADLLRGRGLRSLDLTWLACVPNVSSCPPSTDGNAVRRISPGGQPRKPRGCALSVHRSVSGRVSWKHTEVERPSTSCEIA